MDNTLRTDNPQVASLWIAWQMTLRQVQGKSYPNTTAAEELRKLFSENYAAISKATEPPVNTTQSESPWQ